MSRKHKYIIVINTNEPQKVSDPLVYSFGNTSGIELHLDKNAASVYFEQASNRSITSAFQNSDYLCSDAVLKILILHLIRYGKPLKFERICLFIDNQREEYCSGTDDPIVCSMIEDKFDSLLSSGWRDPKVQQFILQTPKSEFDCRFSALMALFLGKSEKFYSKKAMYLWMAMNGLYNYLINQVDPTIKKDTEKQKLLCKYYGIKNGRIGENNKIKLRGDAIKILSKTSMTPSELFSDLKSGKSNDVFEQIKAALTKNGDQSGMELNYFFFIWLPYQIRCTYFHSEKDIPLFALRDDSLIRALKITNYFVEQFVEEKLLEWMYSKHPTDKQVEKLQNDFLQKNK